MVIFGIDAHKRTHTAVVADDRRRKLGERTTGTTSADHLRLLACVKKWGTVTASGLLRCELPGVRWGLRNPPPEVPALPQARHLALRMGRREPADIRHQRAGGLFAQTDGDSAAYDGRFDVGSIGNARRRRITPSPTRISSADGTASCATKCPVQSSGPRAPWPAQPPVREPRPV